MGPLGVVEVHPSDNDPLGHEAVGEFLQVDGLVFEQTPNRWLNDVVDAPGLAVDRDPGAGYPLTAGGREAGELAATVGVEAPWHTVAGLLRRRHEGSRFGSVSATWSGSKEDIETRVSRLPKTPRLHEKGRVEGTREMVVRSNYIVVYTEDAKLRPYGVSCMPAGSGPEHEIGHPVYRPEQEAKRH